MSPESFRHWLRAILPRGGALVAFASVYIDESGSHDGSPVLCLAGYIFVDDQAALFTEEWQKEVLDPYGLPYFHMIEGTHNTGVFGHLTRQQCIDAEKKAIKIIHRRSAQGFSAAVKPDEYDEIIQELQPGWSPYTSCLSKCLNLVEWWAERTGFVGDIAYFFEAGHANQGEANRVMTDIFSYEETRRMQRYASHTFGEKAKFPPLQAADMLAWLTFTHIKRSFLKHDGMRKDLKALLRPEDRLRPMDRRYLRNLRNKLERKIYPGVGFVVRPSNPQVNPFVREPNDHFRPIKNLIPLSNPYATWEGVGGALLPTDIFK